MISLVVRAIPGADDIARERRRQHDFFLIIII